MPSASCRRSAVVILNVLYLTQKLTIFNDIGRVAAESGWPGIEVDMVSHAPSV